MCRCTPGMNQGQAPAATANLEMLHQLQQQVQQIPELPPVQAYMQSFPDVPLPSFTAAPVPAPATTVMPDLMPLPMPMPAASVRASEDQEEKKRVLEAAAAAKPVQPVHPSELKRDKDGVVIVDRAMSVEQIDMLLASGSPLLDQRDLRRLRRISNNRKSASVFRKRQLNKFGEIEHEAQRLRSDNERLQAQLASAMREISSLRARLADAQSGASHSSPGSSVGTDTATSDLSIGVDPLAPGTEAAYDLAGLYNLGDFQWPSGV